MQIADAFLHPPRRRRLARAKDVSAALHVRLKVQEAQAGVDTQAVARFDGCVRVIRLDDLAVAHDPQSR